MKSKYLIYEKKILKDYLMSRHLSKSYIYKLELAQAIFYEREDEKKNIPLNYILKPGDVVIIDYSLLENNKKQGRYDHDSQSKNNCSNLEIVYESTEVIAVFKNNRLLVHSDGSNEESLLDFVILYLQSKDDDSFIRPLHRIDYEASGVVVFSKNVLSHAEVSYQMEVMAIEKEYLVKISGFITENGIIEIGISKDRHNSKKYIASKKGKQSRLEYFVLEHVNKQTILKVKLITGRPHQIRVSFAHIKHPVVGDDLYGGGGGVMQLLSQKMTFMLNSEKITIVTNKTLKDL